MTSSLNEEKDVELISVIVPVYQVRDYIQECIESIRNQIYKNIEIIIVDDGSTDGSDKLCDQEAKKDSRIRVIHQNNQGLSMARNIGITNAKGEYIALVDSDDYVNINYLNNLYALLKKYNADIAVCDYTRKIFDTQRGHDYAITSEQMLREWHGKRKRIETVCWNKLYKKSIFGDANENIFPVGKEHEDIYTSHLFVEKADKIAITDNKLYFYRKRENSITSDTLRKRDKINQELEAQKERMNYFKDNKYYFSWFRLMLGHKAHCIKYGLEKYHG